MREGSEDDLLWERGGQLCTRKTCVWEASLDHAARDQETGVMAGNVNLAGDGGERWNIKLEL